MLTLLMVEVALLHPDVEVMIMKKQDDKLFVKVYGLFVTAASAVHFYKRLFIHVILLVLHDWLPGSFVVQRERIVLYLLEVRQIILVEIDHEYLVRIVDVHKDKQIVGVSYLSL